MTRKPVTRKAAIWGRVMLAWAVLWIAWQLIMYWPLGWYDAVGVGLGVALVLACLVQEVHYRQDRREGHA